MSCCRHELDGPLDVFDPQSSTWTSHATHIEGLESSSKQPPKRSVHGFVPFHGQVNIGGKKAVALMFMGEGEGAPKELGHDGAGKVSLSHLRYTFAPNDISVLILRASSSPTFMHSCNPTSRDTAGYLFILTGETTTTHTCHSRRREAGSPLMQSRSTTVDQALT